MDRKKGEVRKMTSKWMDIAKKALEPADKVHQNYIAWYNDQNGYVVLSNRKLLFVSEKGLFKKSYDLVLEVPYDKIDEIIRNGNALTLIEEEKRHIFKTGYASAIERSIKHLKESTIMA